MGEINVKKPDMSNLKKEIKTYMDKQGIGYTSGMTKKDLLQKIENAERRDGKRKRAKQNPEKRKARMKTRNFSDSPKMTRRQDKQKFGSAFALLRVALGLMFLGAGWSKIRSMMGEGGTADFFSSLGIPLAEFFAWGVGVIEIIGGIALILGVLLSLTSTLLTIIMIVAMFLTAVVGGIDVNGIIEHLIYIGALLSIMFDDVKAYAVDKFLE